MLNKEGVFSSFVLSLRVFLASEERRILLCIGKNAVDKLVWRQSVMIVSLFSRLIGTTSVEFRKKKSFKKIYLKISAILFNPQCDKGAATANWKWN